MLQFAENDDLIDICMDNVFKAVFARNTRESRTALSSLLSAVIGRDLEAVVISANEPPVDDLRDRQIRFDISCKTAEGEPANVEMSLSPDPCEPERIEFYMAKLFTGQNIRGAGKTYGDLKAAYQVAILGREKFFADGEFLHQFEYYDPVRQIPLGGKSKIITVELSKLDRVVEKPAEEMTASEHWGIFFRYLTDKSRRGKINEVLKHEEGIAMAGKVLLTISKDEVERARLLSEYKYILDTQSKLEGARREGLQKGLQEGRQEGRQEEKLKIALNLKTLGVTTEQIAKSTGLGIQQIEDL
jgi:predicted transposase/invertase (TIGR01784 family)